MILSIKRSVIHVLTAMFSNTRNEPGSRRSPKCVLCVYLTVCLLFLLLILIFITVTVAIIVGTATGRQPTDPGRSGPTTITDSGRSAALYSPGDTRLVSYGNSFFCEAISLQSNSTLGIKLQLIETDEAFLSDKHSFNITHSTRTTVYWSYYLYPESKVRISHCTHLANYDRNWTLIEIRGRNTFLAWMRSPNSTFDNNNDININQLSGVFYPLPTFNSLLYTRIRILVSNV